MTSKDRQRQLERERYERVRARMASDRATAKKRNVVAAITILVTVVVVAAGVIFLTSGNDTKKAPAAASAPTSTAPAGGYLKTGTASKDVGVPVFDAAAAAKPYSATLQLTQGDVTFTANTAKAPHTTFSFEYLAGKGYFDNTKCHRLTTSGIFVLQCGDPAGTGAGGPGYQFPDENLTGATYPAGTIAMANAGPGTNGSQFFIVYKDTQLPPSYTPWGTVTAGLDVVGKIAATGTANGSGDGAPKTDVMIKKAVITAG